MARPNTGLPYIVDGDFRKRCQGYENLGTGEDSVKATGVGSINMKLRNANYNNGWTTCRRTRRRAGFWGTLWNIPWGGAMRLRVA